MPIGRPSKQDDLAESPRAKAQLDVAPGPNGERFAAANDEHGISALLKLLAPSDLVIREATGGLEVPVASALATAGIGVAVVNSRQVRDFARATGQLASAAIGFRFSGALCIWP